MVTTCGIYLYSVPMKKFLLCHATRSRSSWSIPKGLPEPGETALEAATREMEEETGIRLNELEVLGINELPPVQYKKQSKTLVSFLVIINNDMQERKLVCSSYVDGKFPEIDRYEWVDADTFCKMAHETQIRNIETIKKLLPR